MDCYEKFEKLIELVGKDSLLIEIENYFSSDDINDFCDHVITHNDLEDEFK